MKPYTIIAILMLLLSSCHSEFDTINTNPNNPEEVQAELLLRHILFNCGEEMSYEAYVAGNLLGQYFTQIDFNLFDRHRLTDPQFGGNPWPVLYKNLRDTKIMLNISSEKTVHRAYTIPGLIMKAYITAILTDIYGDVPYFEALNGVEGITRPSYDNQESIYTSPDGILDNLETAIEMAKLIDGTYELEGDILFNGDIDSWIRFAQSLRIKYLMRISDRINIASDIQEIYSNSSFILDNNQNASFDFTDNQPNNFRMANLRDGDFNLFVMSETFEDILKSHNDPRMLTYFRPSGSSITGSDYNGLRNGPDAAATSISVNNYSLPGEIFRESTSRLDANFMTAWETYFLLAEAAHKKLINASSHELYNEAISMAFEYWQTDMPQTYLEEFPVAFKEETALKQIITQKYIANINNSYESWLEYRRTGFPELKPVSASLNEGVFPVKMPYPADEQALNTENFNMATMGNGNSINVRVWWDIH